VLPISTCKRDIEMINASEADWFHIIMDGVLFRTSLTECLFWNPLINMPKNNRRLMIVDPDRYIKTF
jgi:ribulose-phosphate 3-epimerase